MINIIKSPILLELIEKDFGFTVSKNGIELTGFYKSGSINLVPQEDGTFIANSRYNQQDKIESFDDLVRLNYEWWDYSKNRLDAWLIPEGKWANEMVRMGLLK